MNTKSLLHYSAAMLLLISSVNLASVRAETDVVAKVKWQELRQQAMDRKRRLIFNNDGNEPVVFCKSVNKDELLALRTRDLLGTQVDSIFYCTWSSGFSLFTHATKAGQVFATREGRFTNNLAPDFLQKGIDPLQAMVDFGREHGIEIFWSMRMNDTHDGSTTDYGPVMFRANKLKLEHPEYLIGSATNKPRYGIWSAVDYGVPQVRELAWKYCEEVCRNYDVDGIELDFFRHAFFFRRSASNQPCGQVELDAMTGLLHRIRDTTEEVGRSRGRPILLAVRVPDSVDYCKYIGLDLEQWLRQGLVDLLIVTGYTQLNPWDYSVSLAHRNRVKVYASLDEPRIRDPEAARARASLEGYRGRALQAWSAGMDGIYMFNFFDAKSPLWSELGDPRKIRELDRTYFLSPRGQGSMYVPHQGFLRVPVLNPANPLPLVPGKPLDLSLPVGELAKPSQPAVLKLRLANLDQPELLEVLWNHRPVSSQPKESGPWIQYVIPPERVQPQLNSVKIQLKAGATKKAALADLSLAISAQK